MKSTRCFLPGRSLFIYKKTNKQKKQDSFSWVHERPPSGRVRLSVCDDDDVIGGGGRNECWTLFKPLCVCLCCDWLLLCRWIFIVIFSCYLTMNCSAPAARVCRVLFVTPPPPLLLLLHDPLGCHGQVLHSPPRYLKSSGGRRDELVALTDQQQGAAGEPDCGSSSSSRRLLVQIPPF